MADYEDGNDNTKYIEESVVDSIENDKEQQQQDDNKEQYDEEQGEIVSCSPHHHQQQYSGKYSKSDSYNEENSQESNRHLAFDGDYNEEEGRGVW